MTHALTRLFAAIPNLNQRELTETDFFTICERENISIIYTTNLQTGCYVIFESKHYIFINRNLKGIQLLKVAWHELAHYFLHFPSQTNFGVAFFDIHQKAKSNNEANALAALALIPFERIDQENSKELRSLLNLRKKLLIDFDV
jgi:Zn-dependent peptidase ImmA (M78 family)